jgi:hypothetical protein
MSQDISGAISQYVRNELGEFITIGDVRVRKSCVVAYNWCTIQGDEGRPFGIKVTTPYTQWGSAIGSREETDKLIERLDWIFKGEQINGT